MLPEKDLSKQSCFRGVKCYISFLSSSPKEVLLYIKMGVPGERCYYPPEELVWDASHDSSSLSLRTAVAALYGLSPDSLLLAKQQLEKWSWEEISNWVKIEEWILKCISPYVFHIPNWMTCLWFPEPAGFQKEEKKESRVTAGSSISS